MSAPSRSARPATRRRPAAARPADLRLAEVTIDRLGAQGDGVGLLEGAPVFVPFTVAGDRVVVRVEGRRGDGLTAALVEVVTPGPGRIEPVCPHFGRCGGCALQHLDRPLHDAWKAGLLTLHLGRAGLDGENVKPLATVPPGRRRRAVFAWSCRRGRAAVGFNVRASHAVIDLEVCPQLDPKLVALIAPLRDLLSGLGHEGSGDVTVTLTEGGADVTIVGATALDLTARETLAAFAEAHDLARLHWRRPGSAAAEPVACRRPALVRFEGGAVEPPPGGFLQPSVEGERLIARWLTAALDGVEGPVADLFAGCGSFTLALSRRGPVHAVEGEAAALVALTAAARAAGRTVTTQTRDLARRPLTPADLARFRAVVLDPPRAGAAAQVAELARPADPAGGPGTVAMVSCNPATLARDLRTLTDGGWKLIECMPIDQFPWSAHVEAVALLRR